MSYKFGKAFERAGIPGMGYQGASWCALNPDGVLTVMGHQNYVTKKDGQWIYEMPYIEKRPPLSPSAKRSFELIRDYFVPGKAVVILVAEFVTDGYVRPDGTWEQSVFKSATGSAYQGRLSEFDLEHVHLLCSLSRKFNY